MQFIPSLHGFIRRREGRVNMATRELGLYTGISLQKASPRTKANSALGSTDASEHHKRMMPQQHALYQADTVGYKHKDAILSCRLTFSGAQPDCFSSWLVPRKGRHLGIDSNVDVNSSSTVEFRLNQSKMKCLSNTFMLSEASVGLTRSTLESAGQGTFRSPEKFLLISTAQPHQG